MGLGTMGAHGVDLTVFRGTYRRTLTPKTLENHMQKNMENEMDTGILT